MRELSGRAITSPGPEGSIRTAAPAGSLRASPPAAGAARGRGTGQGGVPRREIDRLAIRRGGERNNLAFAGGDSAADSAVGSVGDSDGLMRLRSNRKGDGVGAGNGYGSGRFLGSIE